MEIVTDARPAVAVTSRPGLSLLENEDWLAVWLAFLSIALVFAGVWPAAPAFGWSQVAELTATLLGGGNLLRLLAGGAAVGALAAAAIFLMNGSVKRFVLGFPVIYGLAALSQAIAGNSAISAWGF